MILLSVWQPTDAALYIVPTPIGNFGDITLRALAVLRAVDLVLSEDTRRTAKLLMHYRIATSQRSFHAFNEHRKIAGIVQRLLDGEQMALVSDAGMPGISDPCYLLVTACLKADITLRCLPGATAFLPALVQAGFPMQSFVFEGFLPRKKGRKERLKALATEARTVALYESPHRLVRTLSDLCEAVGKERKVCVVRELTKLHEGYYRGTLEESMSHFTVEKPRGEFVIILRGFSKS